MSDPCPSCGEPLSNEGTFCKECGYDVDLAIKDYRGEGTELPEDEQDYQAFLKREGLSNDDGAPGQAPWGKLLLILIAVCVILFVMLKASGR